MKLVRGLLLLSALMLFSACTISLPFEHLDAQRRLDPDRPVLVALTHVTLGPDHSANEMFWRYVFRIHDEFSNVPGAVGHSLRKRLFADEAWTMSAWEDEGAMQRFVRGGLHKEAVERAGRAIQAVEYARLTVPRSRLPLEWAEAESILRDQNPTSAVEPN